jgi:tRNA(Leu) C34 or U34 (ribose-2'-O)-methylase TrmL
MATYVINSAVMDMIDLLSHSGKGELPVEMDKLDFGQYGDHLTQRPYATVLEGVNWYLHQDETQHLPEEMVMRLVAHNFGIPLEEAVRELNAATQAEGGVVDLA